MLLVWLVVAVGLAKGARPADEITTLPGWEGALPSRMFAGYVDAGADR